MSDMKSNTEEVLTVRQQQVLTLASHGLTYKQVGAELGISMPTAKWHMREAMWRLDARSKHHAVAVALTRGLIRG